MAYRSRLAGWISLGLVSTVAVLLSACATLGPRIQGQTELVAWQATDLKLEQRVGGGRWSYTFELLIRETRGMAVTFSMIETAIYQPGAGSWTGRYPGSWRLDSHDQFRIPLQATLFCHSGADACVGPNVPIPLWRIIMEGTDDRGQAVKAVIDLTAPRR